MSANDLDSSVNFDKILDKIGNLGKYQILHIIILFMSGAPCGMLSLSNVLFAGIPKYWCSSGIDNYSDSQFSNLSNINNSAINVCGYSDEYKIWKNGNVSIEESCTDWTFDKSVYISTIVTEWEFVCSKEWLASLSQTTYMSGILLGSFIGGAIGDRFGRKKASLLGLLIMSGSELTSSFIPNYGAFLAVRVLAAVGNFITFLNAFVYIMEIIATKYRMPIGVYYQAPFAAGYMLFAGVGYLIRHFRHLQLFIGILPLLPIPLYIFLDESPRWLMTRGRFDEACSIVKKMCSKNGVEYPEDLMERETAALVKENNNSSGNIQISQKSVRVFDLVRTPKLRCRIIAVSYGWILCSLTFYGLSQASSDLVGGPYLNLFLSGLMEFPGMFLSCWLLNKIGRRWMFSGTLFLSGTCVLFIPAVINKYEIITTVLSLTGKMAISASFAVVFVYTAELFPTVIRSLALGTGSMCSRIGSIISPNLILLGKVWVGFPFVVFGSATLIGGFVTLLLPETLNQPLMETVEEVERYGKSACKNICEFPCIKKSQQGTEEIKETDEDDYDCTTHNNLMEIKL